MTKIPGNTLYQYNDTSNTSSATHNTTSSHRLHSAQYIICCQSSSQLHSCRIATVKGGGRQKDYSCFKEMPVHPSYEKIWSQVLLCSACTLALNPNLGLLLLVVVERWHIFYFFNQILSYTITNDIYWHSTSSLYWNCFKNCGGWWTANLVFCFVQTFPLKIEIWTWTNPNNNKSHLAQAALGSALASWIQLNLYFDFDVLN